MNRNKAKLIGLDLLVLMLAIAFIISIIPTSNKYQSYPFTHDEDGVQGYALLDQLAYRIRCFFGNNDACTDAGSATLSAEKEKGKEGSYEEASKFYKIACDGGSALGCSNLGRMYYDGLYHEKDYKKSLSLFLKACDTGSYRGCSNLGLLYHGGKSVAIDYSKAFYFYKKACDVKIMSGCHNLSNLYYDGKGVAENTELSYSLYKKACDAGIKVSCGSLSNRFKSNNSGTGKFWYWIIGLLIIFGILGGGNSSTRSNNDLFGALDKNPDDEIHPDSGRWGKRSRYL